MRFSHGAKALAFNALAAVVIDTLIHVALNSVMVIDLRQQDAEDLLLVEPTEPLLPLPDLVPLYWVLGASAVVGISCWLASLRQVFLALRGDGAPASRLKLVYCVLAVLVIGIVVLCFLRPIFYLSGIQAPSLEQLSTFAAIVLNAVLTLLITLFGLIVAIAYFSV